MAYILVAMTEDKTVIYLNDSLSPEALRTMRKSSSFYCPDCCSQVILKIGEVKIPHFAHKNLSDCGTSEGESTLHIQGKVLLHQFFTGKNIPVEVEKYLPQIRQRPDLLICNDTAIEFQCSAISAAEVAKRSAAYAEQHLRSAWIAGSREQRLNSIQLVKLLDYQTEMLIGQDRTRHLLLLNPESREFQYFSNLFHISGSRWIGKVMTLSVDQQTFPFAVPKPLNRPDFEKVCTVFETAKISYVRSQMFARNRHQNAFWLLCYKLGLDKQNLPDYFGVPVIGSECIGEHAVIWQLKVMRALRQGKGISDFIASGAVKAHRKAEVSQLEEVLADYTAFLSEVMVQTAEPDVQKELLYDIYCKRVRKLRK